MSNIKFAHGTKANAEAAVADGRLDFDDLVIFSETNDEIGIVDHQNTLQRIKGRTNEDIVLTDKDIDLVPAGYTVPAGTSIDDLVNLFKTWLNDNKDNINFSKNSLSPATTSTLGGVKIGSGLNITDEGVLSSTDNKQPNWGNIKITLYNSKTTYAKGDYVINPNFESSDGETNGYLLWVYESLVDNNLGNALPIDFVDTDYWKSVGEYPIVISFDDTSGKEGGILVVNPSLGNGVLPVYAASVKSMIATNKHLGFVQVGNGLSITEKGVLSVTSSEGIKNELLTTMDLGVGENGLFNCVVKIYTQYITITLTAAANATNQLSTTSIQNAIESWDMTSFDEDTRNLFTPLDNAQTYIGQAAFAFVTFDGVCEDSSYRDSYDYPIFGYFCDVNSEHKTLEIRVTGNSFYTADSTRRFFFPESQMNNRGWSQTFTFLNANAIPTE